MSTNAAEYIITLYEQVETKYRNYLIKRIEETGLSVEFASHDDSFDFLKIYTSKQWLINYLSTEEHLEEYLAINTKANKSQDSITKKFEEFEKLPKSAIVPSALLCHIIHTTLTSISIDKPFINMLNNDKKRHEKKKLHLMDKLIVICKNVSIIDDIFPMNDMHVEITDKNKMKKWNLFFNVSAYLSHIDHTNNLNKIRDYYGEEMAFYFAFMEHYTKWLFIPGICGLLFYITRSEGFDIDESKYMPFFALFVCIWSHFMIKYWNRRASDLALNWNTIEFANEKYLIQSDIRPEFRGIIRLSEITGKPERYYSQWKRYPKFMFGIFITLFLLTLVFIMMICSLNLQGYIHSQNSIIYIETFNALSKPGAIFDSNSNIMFIIPTLIHCCFVFFLNIQYSKVAYKLTEWENWKFESDFENSLILKRFLFEFLDAFLPLFYICFYEMKMEILTCELFSLFLCDELRRIFTESVIPLLMHLWELKTIEKNEKNHKHSHKNKNESHNILIESKLEKYVLFDDYLEMITQFGYITMFASCYPLAAILSLISNIFEVWSDSFKLCFLSQRPIVERAYNIHLTWVKILQFMAWFSILTNCYIFAFSSEQMEEWFPQMFNPDNNIPQGKQQLLQSGYQEIKTGHGRYVVLIMFGIEHIIAFICLFIHYLIPNITNNVNIQMQRKQHQLYHQYIENIKRKRNLLHKNVGRTPIKETEQ
eukprot:126927_1